MLKQRLITGFALLGLALWSIFGWPDTLFHTLVGGVLALAAWEWARLSGMRDDLQRTLYGLAHAVIFALLELLGIVADLLPWLATMATLGWLLIAGWVWLWAEPRDDAPGVQWQRLAGGPLLFVPAWVVIVSLHSGTGEIVSSGGLLLYSLMLIWAADVGAYFAGRRFGKHKLAPRISPGKTWEGVAGGMGGVLVLALIGLYWHGGDISAGTLLPASLLAGAISVVGDLFESYYKRSAGVKDSSDLLPGHGGILDRLDSVLAAAPVFAAGLLWF
jgi:phosphatidate cytidylyltransferase